MRISKLLFFLFFFFSCQKKLEKLQKPNFLIGKWIRINTTDSLTTYETWQPNFTGVGLTLKENDTTFFEELAIITKSDSLFLQVTGVNETPTLFQFTNQTNTSFTAENPKNEFPKKIKYYTDANLLKAEISANDFKIEFIFEQIKK